MTRFLLLFAVFASVAHAEIRDERFPVSAMLSAPFPTEIVAHSNSLAYVINDQGLRNISYAGAPDFEGRQLTAYRADDGIGVLDLQFTPDGKHIVYVRGGAPNSAGELPNPASLPDGGELAIYVVPVAGGEPRKLDDGFGPAIHPSGDRIAYVNKGKVFCISLDDAEAEPEALFGARGSTRDLAWSPDGEQLLFRSSRRTHSYIGIWQASGEDSSIRWLSPSLDRDESPVWSPEGTQVAFMRLPSRDLADFPFGPDREGIPWSIRIADAATGESTEIWRADERRGSAYRGFESDAQIFWAAGDRIVFAWERTGWNQFYSVPVKGGQPEHLTPGNFEIEYAALTADGRSLVYASNQDDMHRRHLWQVGVKGGKPKLLTPGKGIEWAPAPLADGSIGLLRSDATRPARPALLDNKGRVRDLAPGVPDGFPRDLVTPVPVEITATDGMKVPAQLFLPKGLRPGEKVPAPIFLHGGSRRQMLLGWHMRGYYHNAYGMSQYLASRGVVALALNYRSGIGYGLDFREALNYGATGNSEFQDVVGAGLYLQSRPEVDPDKITTWGGSYGGYLTAHALAQASDLFVAGVDIHGVHDWNDSIWNFVPWYNKNDYPERSAIAFQSSPMNFLDGWRSPVRAC